MARVRRYRQGWLLVPALVASAIAETGGAFAYQALKPVPPPPPWILTVAVSGEGDGGVIANVVGVVKPLGHCTKAMSPCKFEVPADRYVTLSAVRGEKMTFEGWNGCEGYAEDILACEVMAFRDRRIAAIFGKVPEAVEVAWLDSAIKAPEIQPPALPRTKKKIEAEKLEEDKQVQVALVKPVTPPPLPPPDVPKPPEQPKPPEEMKSHMVAVEVDDDQHVVDKAPDDATKISDKNRDVTEETHATKTNLDKESKGQTAASVKSDDTTSPEVGGPDDKVAHLEEVQSENDTRIHASDHSGEDDHATGQIVGEEGHDGQNGTGDRQPGLLAMRGVGGMGSLGDRMGDGKKEGTRGKPGLRTSLDFDAYERIIGKDKAEEERQIAKAAMGARKGRYEKRLDAIKSSLENFVGDVRPGNQTALKTRASPYAIYLARMHRRIHERWGFGFLEELDRRSASDPLNDENLETVLEVAVNPDGTLYKTTVVRTSGHTDFDVAALDAVISSAPFERTPDVIRSVDQRVYLRWAFDRGPRQCGTWNAEPYILTSIPGGVVPLDASSQAVISSGPIKSTGSAGDGSLGDEERGAKPAATTKPTEEPVIVAKSGDAAMAANVWIGGLTSSSVPRLMKASAVPFVAGGATAARTTGDLQTLYEGLLGEIGTVKSWELTDPADFTRKTGIPATVGSDRLVILVVTSSEKLGIVLSPSPSTGDYRATQLLR